LWQRTLSTRFVVRSRCRCCWFLVFFSFAKRVLGLDMFPSWYTSHLFLFLFLLLFLFLFCSVWLFFLKAGSVEAYQESSTDNLDLYTRRVDVPLLWQG
jgi:hypothetical protein